MLASALPAVTMIAFMLHSIHREQRECSDLLLLKILKSWHLEIFKVASLKFKIKPK